MPHDRSSYDVQIDVDVARAPRAGDEARLAEDVAFRMAICGDFSGRSGSTAPTKVERAAWRIDRDDFDHVLATVAPSLHLELSAHMVVDVRIREIDDFHPDNLFDQVPQFAQLRALRSTLANPATFARAAAELSTPTSAPTRPSIQTSGSLLDSIVGVDAPASHGVTASDNLYEFIQRAMAPHLVARTDPHQAELLAQMDATIAAIMRSLLHHPAFQALESLWRGVHRLVRHVETDERLQIHLIDAGRESLMSDLRGDTSVQSTTTYQRLSERAAAAQGGWGLLVAHCAFGGAADDIAAMEGLAGVGMALNAPWLAESHPELALGPPEGSAASWKRLRSMPAAQYLGLALPRVLLRLPYGKDTDAINRFAFEELENADAHSSYLWGNPALFCATLVAQGFTERGAGLALASPVIDGLPLHLVTRDGSVTAKPCAEVLMSEDDALAILDAGFIPMLSLRDQDVVRVPRLQSIAEPASRLRGRLAR